MLAFPTAVGKHHARTLPRRASEPLEDCDGHVEVEALDRKAMGGTNDEGARPERTYSDCQRRTPVPMLSGSPSYSWMNDLKPFSGQLSATCFAPKPFDGRPGRERGGSEG